MLICSMLVGAGQSRGQVSQETIELRTMLIPVTVNVFDSKGKPIDGLSQDQFAIFEDDKPQTIAYFNESDQPIILTILFDCSRSMESDDRYTEAMVALKEFMKLSHPDDLIAMVTFNDEVRIALPFTRNNVDIFSGIKLTPYGEKTLLFDAIALTMDYSHEFTTHAAKKEPQNLAQPLHPITPPTREVILVITDGQDNGSHCNFKQIKEKAIENYSLLYCICINGYEFDANKFTGEAVMAEIAESSGGCSFNVRDGKQLKEACQTIASGVRKQYQIMYYPTGLPNDGKFHNIKVSVKDKKSKVRYRQGYYAPPPGS